MFGDREFVDDLDGGRWLSLDRAGTTCRYSPSPESPLVLLLLLCPPRLIVLWE